MDPWSDLPVPGEQNHVQHVFAKIESWHVSIRASEYVPRLSPEISANRVWNSTIVDEIRILYFQPLRFCLLLSLLLSLRAMSVLINCLCALACHGAWKESLGVVWCTYAVGPPNP